MKKTVLILFFTVVLGVLYTLNKNVLSYSNGAPTGYTCAQGEKSCSEWACHNGTPNSCGGGTMLSTMENISNGYIPGTTYNIMPYVTQNASTKIGFQTVALLASGQPAGSITITNTKTQMNTAGGKEYVTHSASGNTGVDLMDWMYEWTAPPQGSGTVTVYAAFIASNNNMAADTGDCIYTDSLIIQENTTGINNAGSKSFLVNFFPTITKDEIVVNYFFEENFRGEYFIYSANGNLMENKFCLLNAGENSFKINFRNYSEGIYFIFFKAGNINKVERVIKF